MLRNTILFGLLLSLNSSFLIAQNVMTYNIRFDNPADGQNQWANRKERVAQTLKYYDVDVCGMQEALHHQILDIVNLNPTYDWVGKGRDDGDQKGEFSPILFNKNKFLKLKEGTFWLSETPDRPSKSWDAALPRVCTWILLKDRKSKKVFYVFNTHFDHIGVTAREKSSELILEKIKEIAGGKTMILTGDFNSKPNDKPIQLLSTNLNNSENVSHTRHFGPSGTFNQFSCSEVIDQPIDFIFLNDFYKNKVKTHATLTISDKGLMSSDHHPVLIRLEE